MVANGGVAGVDAQPMRNADRPGTAMRIILLTVVAEDLIDVGRVMYSSLILRALSVTVLKRRTIWTPSAREANHYPARHRIG